MELTRTDHHPRTTTSAPSRTSRPAFRRPARRWRPRGTRPETSPAPVPWVVMGPGLTLTRRDHIPGYAQRLATRNAWRTLVRRSGVWLSPLGRQLRRAATLDLAAQAAADRRPRCNTAAPWKWSMPTGSWFGDVSAGRRW